jgi:hypothetical protein
MYVEAMQPFLLANPKDSPLYVLDELTNLNKHRNPLKTVLCCYSEVEPIVPQPHMRAIKRLPIAGAEAFKEIPIWLWIGVADDSAINMEVITLLDTLAQYLGNEVLPLFKQFLD